MECVLADCTSTQVMCLDEEDAEIDYQEQPNGKNYMCEECGHEMTEVDLKFRNYKIGVIMEVE